jgi:signal transduction histidine kinase
MNQGASNISLYIIITIVVMLLLILSMLLLFMLSQRKKTRYLMDMQVMRSAQQNMLIEAAVRSEELERHRIAEALHDEVGALLSSTKLHFNAINKLSLDEEDQAIHQRANILLDDGIGKVRGIAHNLHSSILKALGLHEAIENFVKKISHGTGIQIQFQLDKTYVSKQPDRDISVYRMVQELMNNLLKYAHPTRITIGSTQENGSLCITIAHNGDGLSQKAFEELRYKPDGLGLKNIQNRIILLKGSIEFYKHDTESGVKMSIPNTAAAGTEA